ncbi:MAG: stage III sporulation protein AA [Agathobacter sp.]|nr:stage III sporulation protein AA [Agathobacter sp.]
MRKINWDGLEEIRVRIGWPVELIYGNHNEWLGNYDSMIDRQCLDEMLNYITGYSIYAMEEELKQGYITFAGGHRIGITGHATYEELRSTNEPQITNMIDIGGLNIRIAHERKGCAEQIIPLLRKENSIYNTVFFAVPGVGKTTCLRDAIRILSNGDDKYPGMKVCVVDERSEIAACVNGKPQNDLGKRTDVLDACPKVLGMRMVLRSMSPDVIAVDELGKEEEFTLLEQMQCSGVKILGTMHAGDMEQVMRNPMIRRMTDNNVNQNNGKSMIERFVELVRLENGSREFRIYDGQGILLWGK